MFTKTVTLSVEVSIINYLY